MVFGVVDLKEATLIYEYSTHLLSEICKRPLDAIYRRHEIDKIRQYEQRVREVEHSSFTPLIFLSSGGMGKVATTFYKRIASMLAEKKHFPFSMSMGLIRCHISYSLLRSSIMCVRGARSSPS